MRTQKALVLCMVLLMSSWCWSAQNWAPSDVGGGGWLQSGAFHPTDPDVILIGTDVTGGIYRTDDFGNSWHPWNDGLANTSEMRSMYVEDLIGIVEPGGQVAFYAATQGGMYRAPDDGSWDWMADDQPGDQGMNPEDTMVIWEDTSPPKVREPISFSALDWNGQDLLVAGAGRVRWASSYETSYYPGKAGQVLKMFYDPDTPQLSSNPALCSVWAYDFNDTDLHWKCLDSALDLGAVRDISVKKINGHNYIAVATPKGIYVYDYEAGTWNEISDNQFMDWANGQSLSPMNYGTGVTAWSLHLTERGTVYAAMQKLGHRKASGVYRIRDAIAQPDANWTWVGNGEAVSPHTDSMWDIGMGTGVFSDPQFIYLTVVDGSDEEDDVLYLGCRKRPYGLFRGHQPASDIGGGGINPLNASWTAIATKTNWSTVFPADFDFGWIGNHNWGLEVIFQPAVFPAASANGPHRIAVQFNGRMHVSDDGGDTWIQSYTENLNGAWFTAGYNEHCVRGLTFMSDGRVVFSNGDTGPFLSTSPDASAYDHISPEVYNYSSPLDDRIKNRESNTVALRPDWRGLAHDVLFVNFSDAIQGKWYGKIFTYEEWKAPAEQWTNITKTLPDVGRFIFHDFDFTDDETIFVSYNKYDRVFGSSGTPVLERYGILKGTYNLVLDQWDWNDWTFNLPDQEPDPYRGATWAADLLANHFKGSRLFVALTRNKRAGGGLYVLPSPGDHKWQLVYNDVSTFRDFRSLAQPADGSLVYAGTRGHSGGVGGVLKCTDPTDAVNPAKWQVIANDRDTGNYPFGFSTELPFWFGDSSYINTPEMVEEHFTAVLALAVDPDNRDNIYAGLSGEGFLKQEGLWFYNSQVDHWYQRSLNKEFYGMGVPVVGFNPAVPGQLFIGTTGQGMYFNGIVLPPPPHEHPKKTPQKQ